MRRSDAHRSGADQDGPPWRCNVGPADCWVSLRLTGESYSWLSAVTTGRRAARQAGKSPPSRPMTTAYISAWPSSAGVTANAKATWLKDCQFIVAAWKPSKAIHAIAAAYGAADQAEENGFANTENTTATLPKPSARSVAISRVRLATAMIHRVDRGEDRADSHQCRDPHTDGADHGPQHLRLARVVVGHADDRDVQSRIGRQRVFERLKAVGRVQPARRRTGTQLPRRYAGWRTSGIAPELRLRDVAFGFEDPDDLPRVFPPAHVRADVRFANWPRAARPAMISFGPCSNIRPSTIFTSGRTSSAAADTPAQRHVRVRSGRLARMIDDDEELRGSDRTALALHDAGRILDRSARRPRRARWSFRCRCPIASR